MTLDLQILPCRADNYAYLLHDAETGATAVVDVPDAAPVRDALAARGWRLTDILITHHHDDHISGVAALAAETGARVTGAAPDARRLPPLDHAVAPGDRFVFGGEPVTVMDAPGHTIGHIAYHLPQSGLLFSGDSLMSWGCGRLFEGSPDQMFATLERMAALPPETLVCSGHEYTEANGRFALSLEPESRILQARMDRVQALRARGAATLPVPLSEEIATNPFLRGADPALAAALGLTGAAPLAVFTEARARKDRF